MCQAHLIGRQEGLGGPLTKEKRNVPSGEGGAGRGGAARTEKHLRSRGGGVGPGQG